MRAALKTYLQVRRAGLAAGICVGLTGLWLLVPGAVGSPQLEFASHRLESWTLLGVLLGLAAARMALSSVQELERRGSRNLLALHLVALALMVATLIICASVFAVARDAGSDALVGIVRNAVSTFGAALLLTRLGGTLPGVVAPLSYVGLCLFIGVDASGQVRPWAFVLDPATGPGELATGIGLTLLGTIAYTTDLKRVLRGSSR